MNKSYIPRAERSSPKIPLIEGAKAYAALRKTVIEAGILDRAYGYYAIMAIFAFGGFLLTVYLIYITSSLLYIAFLGILLSFFSVQIAGLFHDAGHRAIFNSTKWNDLVGHLAGFFLVDSFNRWRPQHDKHHSNTNVEDEDPDLVAVPFSFTNSKFMRQKGLANLFKKYQAYTYYPVRSLVLFAIRTAAFLYLLERFSLENSWKLAGLIIGLGVWFVLPFAMFDWGKAVVIILTSNLSLGVYLSNIFAPNHKGMPEIKKGMKISFLEHQIMTSRNLTDGFLSELFFVGLGYQIEHHLFTNCPRNKLKLVTPHVKKLCRKLGLEYTEVGVVETNRIILSELQQVALAA